MDCRVEGGECELLHRLVGGVKRGGGDGTKQL